MHNKLTTKMQSIFLSSLLFLPILFLIIPSHALAATNTSGYVAGYAGTSIDTWDGNLDYSRQDLYIPARSLPIDITMSYNLNRRDEDLGFGNGWQLSYDMSYVYSATTRDVIIRYGSGGENKFKWNGSSYTSPTGSQHTLSENKYGAGYLLTTKYGTEYYFDSTFNNKVTTIKNSQGDTLTFSYIYTDTRLTGITDTHGRNITLEYDTDTGRLDRIIDPNTTPPRTIQYQYDTTGNGNLIKVIDPEEGEIAYGYSAGDDGTYLMDSITDPSGNSFSISYDSVFSDRYFVNTISNGADTISIEYFTTSRTIDYSVDATVYKSIVHEYNNSGELIQDDKEIKTWDSDNNVTSRTDENGNTTYYEYDNSNLTKILSPPVDGVVYSTTYTYIYTAGGYRMKTRTDANGNPTTYDYDDKGRRIKITEPLGRITQYAYNEDNNLYSETNPNGITTKYEYDSNGNRTLMNRDPAGLNLVTDYDYDNVGNMIEVIDPRGNITTNTYDLLNRKTTVTNALLDDHIYSYDGKGNILKEIDERDNITRYQYNFLNLKTKVIDALLYSSTYEYDFLGNLVKKTDANGNNTYYEYEYSTCAACGKDVLISVTDALDNTTLYSHDPVGNLLKKTDANDHITRYAYDALNRQRTITNDLGDSTALVYDGVGNRIKKTDAEGRVTYMKYDDLNRQTMMNRKVGDTADVVDGDDSVTYYTYDEVGNRIDEIDPNDNTLTNTYDAVNRIVTLTNALEDPTFYFYDDGGNRIKTIDAEGRVTYMKYDDLNHQTMINRKVGDTVDVVDGDDSVTYYTYDEVGNLIDNIDPNDNTLTNTYDAVNRITTVTNALDGLTLYSYDAVGNRIKEIDAEGRVTHIKYDDLNRKTMANRKVGDTADVMDSDDSVTYYTYDNVGNRIDEIDPNDNTLTNTYDAVNRIVTVTNALNYSTIYSYDDVGNRIKTIDAEGKVTYIKYDDLNRQTMVNRKVGDTTDVVDGDDSVTYFTYDPVGNRIDNIDPNDNTLTNTYDALNRIITMTNALNELTVYTYDVVGNRIEKILANGNTISNYYDDLNRLILVYDTIGTVAEYTYDYVGNKTSETSANKNITKYEYDVLNRPQHIIDPASNTTTNVYDAVGNQIKTIDKNGKVTYSRFDDLNRLTLQNRKMNDTDDIDDVDDILTEYGYDLVGNRTSITDSNTNITGYNYDAINQLIQESYEDGTTRTFDYDGVGNLIERVDQNNNILTNTYDDLHRLIYRDYPDYPYSNDDIFTYDPGGRMISAYNANTTVINSYDPINRLAQQIQETETITKTIGYTYDTANRTRVIDYPGGRQITEIRDERGRMDLVEDTTIPSSQSIAIYTYDGDQLAFLDYPNGTTTEYSYNNRKWVTGLKHYIGGNTFSNFAYGFDNEGNRDYAERSPDDSNSEKYGYDDAYRLNDFTRGTLVNGEIYSAVTNTTYSLDELGNWDSKTIRIDSIDYTETRKHNEMNEITDIDGAGLTYDDNGNLIDDAVYNYEYDFENRLIQVRDSIGPLVNYKYDPMGRRIEKEDVVNAITTNYYLDKDRVIEEQKSDATTLTYVYGNQIDEVLQMEKVLQMENVETYYYHPNSLGSIDAVTDISGNVIEYYRYDAYGDPEVYDSSWVYQGSSSRVGNPYLFTGRRLDDETDLYYYRARYYSPYLGRFLQHDPLGYEDGMNLYEYVSGNVINRIDAFGKMEAVAIGTESYEPDNSLTVYVNVFDNFKFLSRYDSSCGPTPAELKYKKTHTTTVTKGKSLAATVGSNIGVEGVASISSEISAATSISYSESTSVEVTGGEVKPVPECVWKKLRLYLIERTWEIIGVDTDVFGDNSFEYEQINPIGGRLRDTTYECDSNNKRTLKVISDTDPGLGD